ncbi:protein kinase domain-containing protein [Tundrisphaera lichenicola]|uniref:protein kinase domain-containing protein n=1 Tax=Tundrisphaera lichenicola TaxID=2029860 RepID=UPI003EC031EA
MSVTIECPTPGCGASAVVTEARLGRDVRCSRCGRKFPLIPGTRLESSPPSYGPMSGYEPPEVPSIPASIGRFRIIRELGRGGMGTVYLAEDAELGRSVALKVPHPAYREAAEVRERLVREARAAARFRHPNFCPIHDIGEVDGVPYLRMSYIEGRTLASMIEPGRPWPERRAAEVVRRLALALAEAHRRGVVHRDLKPANVMVDVRGKLVLMDFGLALRLDADDPRITTSGAIVGTPAYMPPEQVEGHHEAIGPRSDLYSLGVILYELLTGRRPFEGSAAMVLGLILVVDAPPPSSLRDGLDPRLEAICLKAIAKRPEDRHASMDELAAALRSWLEAPPRSSEPTFDWPVDTRFRSRVRLSRPVRRKSPIAGLMAASTIAVTLATLAWIVNRPEETPYAEPGAVTVPIPTPEALEDPDVPEPPEDEPPAPIPVVEQPPPAPKPQPRFEFDRIGSEPVASVVVPRPAGSNEADFPPEKTSRPRPPSRKPRRRASPDFVEEPRIILVPVEVPVPVLDYPFPPPRHLGGPRGPHP